MDEYAWRPTPPSELDLDSVVSRAQDGDLEAFEHLVDTFQPSLFRLGMRMLGNRTEAEDLVQDTLITAWRKLETLGEPAAFRSWLYRSASNRCLDVLRKRNAHATDAADPGSLAEIDRRGAAAPASMDGNPARAAESAESMRALAELLKTLPDEQRLCWTLRELHDCSYAEIASIVGITETAARGRISRARKRLAEGMAIWH